MPEPAPWHPYVFDAERRRFVGDFEGMYRAEQEQGFDSWHQSDPGRLDNRVAALLLERINYRTALDLGCGKGVFTAGLKRADTEVTGVDLSETAIDEARASFPDVRWERAEVLEYLAGAEPVDLILAREVLSYVENWREVLAGAAELCRHLLVGLYVPPDPIGFVASHDELERELRGSFEVLESIELRERRLRTWLCASRAANGPSGRG